MIVKFIKKLVLFMLPVLLVLGCIEYLLSVTDNIYTLKKKALEKHADSLQVLVVGTSQSYHSLNPALFNRPSLNLAAPAQPLYYDCKIILDYLPVLKNLRLVVIPLDYITLFFNENTPNNYRFAYYHFWKFENHSISNTDIRKYSLLAVYKPPALKEIFIAMMKGEKHAPSFATGSMLENGFIGLGHPADSIGFEKKSTEQMADWNSSLLSVKDFEGNTQTLENLVAILQEKKIKVLFITDPVIPNIYKKYDPSFLAMQANFIRHITSSYSNTKYVDFSLDARFTINYFFDPNHLDAAGAAKFSEIVRHDYIDKMIP